MESEGKGVGKVLLIWGMLLVLGSQSMVIPVTSRSLDMYGDEKNFHFNEPQHQNVSKCNTPKSPSGHGTSNGSDGTHSSPAITPPPQAKVTTPSAPTTPDPSSTHFIGTCDYWKKNPQKIRELFGFWGTIANVFGASCIPAYGHNLSLQEALGNTRSDGIGALYREGTASYLNSMVDKGFPFTTDQVRDRFVGATASDHAASAQAEQFKMANEGRL